MTHRRPHFHPRCPHQRVRRSLSQRTPRSLCATATLPPEPLRPVPSGGSIAETIAQSTATVTQATKQSPKLESKNEKNSTMPASMARAAAAMVVEEAKEKELPKLGQSQRYWRGSAHRIAHRTMRTHVQMRTLSMLRSESRV